jgi:thiamine-phosphate pyrophosphorylase
MASRPKQAQPRPVPRFYLVTPPVSDPAAFASELMPAVEAADIAAVLLRLADADEHTLINSIKDIAPPVQDRGIALLLEGRPELVARSGADGAHLNSTEALRAALEALKPDRIVGVGGLRARHDAMVAAESGADYVLFGSVEEAANLERVAWCAEVLELPCVGYAREEAEIAALIEAGADFIALDYIWREPRRAGEMLAAAARHMRLPETAS